MKSFDKLIVSLRRWPGIGPKQAERLATHLLRAGESEVETLVAAIRGVREQVRPCRICFNFSDEPACGLCSDPDRDDGTICVVGDPSDVAAIERSRSFRGRYHVLHGVLSPLDGIGPRSLRIEELLARIKEPGRRTIEVILATNHDVEGEATALYLTKLLQPLSVKVTRIAMGVPLGGDLAYIDERTLSHALEGRRAV